MLFTLRPLSEGASIRSRTRRLSIAISRRFCNVQVVRRPSRRTSRTDELGVVWQSDVMNIFAYLDRYRSVAGTRYGAVERETRKACFTALARLPNMHASRLRGPSEAEAYATRWQRPGLRLRPTTPMHTTLGRENRRLVRGSSP